MSDIYYAVAHRSQKQIDTFKTRYEKFDDSVIPEVFEKSLGLRVKSWEPSSSWGSSHVIYFVKLHNHHDLVFRANTGFGEPESVMVTEKLITDKVAGLGIPTNIILFADVSRKNFPFDYQIQEVLIGSDPEQKKDWQKEDYDNLSFELGQNIAKIHSIKLDGWGQFDKNDALRGKLKGTKSSFYDYLVTCLDSDLEYLINDEVINSKAAIKIKQLFLNNKKLINSTTKGSLIHHDLADHNITHEGKHLAGIFDWETAVVADPILDIASCPTWRTHYPREEKLIEGYTSITPLPENFEEKKNLYLLRTMVWKAVYAIRMDIMTPERKERFNNILKLLEI